MTIFKIKHRILIHNPIKLIYITIIVCCFAAYTIDLQADSETPDKSQSNKYAGFLIGVGKSSNEFVDVEGFANWGVDGWTVNYSNSGPVVGGLFGYKIGSKENPGRVEFDFVLSDIYTSTDRVDPTPVTGGDETAVTQYKWITSLRVGMEAKTGNSTFFANTGLAIANIKNSTTDLDWKNVGTDESGEEIWKQLPDPDDSFYDNSLQAGLVFGLGMEFTANVDWIIRVETSLYHFGKHTYNVNHSGNGRCGPQGIRKPCEYTINNKLQVFRLAFMQQF